MKVTILCFLAVLCIAVNLQAQQYLECGVGLAEGTSIKQRMLDNRANVRMDEIDAVKNRRMITWIPVTIHNVSNNGNGYTSEFNIHSMFCDLNNDYASQDIQFYLNSPISYVSLPAVHYNAFSNNARYLMINNKVPNTLNIYVGRSINNPTASFYSSAGDFVFMLNGQVNGATSTCSHEVGHFFTLAHTFFGWENNDYQALYGGGNAPNTINGSPVEREARTGAGANCSTAADGFCDTPADYYYTRENCPYSATGLVARDPSGTIIAPSDSNVMSYFVYGCRRNFTNDQKTAILADIVSRGWTSFPPPPTTATNLSGAQFAPISPLAGQTITSSGGLVNLSWNAIPGATSYYLEVFNTLAGIVANVNSPIVRLEVSGTSYDLNASDLNLNSTYAWRIKPLNAYYTCADLSTFYLFKYGQQVTGLDNLQNNKSQLELAVYPNPATNNEITVEVAVLEAAHGTFELLAIDGRSVGTYPASNMKKGINQFKLNIADLTVGTYILTLSTEKGVYHKKFLVL